MLNLVKIEYNKILSDVSSSHSRFDKTLDYFEEILKLMSLTLISLYRENGFNDIKLNEKLTKLAIPSLGDWNYFITSILKWYRGQEECFSNEIFMKLEKCIYEKIENKEFVSYFKKFSVEIDGKKSGVQSVPFRLIIDYIIRLRNKIAHGGKPSDSFYRRMADLIKKSIDLWIEIIRPLNDYELKVLDDKIKKLTGLRYVTLLMSVEEKEILNYYPFIIAKKVKSENQLYYINGNNRLKRAEYINHQKGKSFTDEDVLLKEQIAFFGSLKGMDIKSSDLGSKVATSLAELGGILIKYDFDPNKKIIGNDFQIVEEIGRGGMGIVFKALQISTNRIVALKVLPKSIVSDESIFYRFKREAETLEAFDHQHIVEFIDFGESEDDVYLAMEYVDGVGLDHVYTELRQIESSKRPNEKDLSEILNKSGYIHGFDKTNEKRPYFFKIAEWIGETASALSYIHKKNILHRDIKPGNIMFDRHTCRAVLLDFGLAKTQDVSVTIQGQFIGTKRYASPEQIASIKHVVDKRSDIYSLGATLYELLTLRPIFVSDTIEKMSKIISTIDPPKVKLLSPDVGADLEVITMKSLEKDPKYRYQSMADFVEDLECFINHKPIKAKPPTATQNIVKWTKRNPAKSSALAAIIILIFISIGSVFYITNIFTNKLSKLLIKEYVDKQFKITDMAKVTFTDIYTFEKGYTELVDAITNLSTLPDIVFVGLKQKSDNTIFIKYGEKIKEILKEYKLDKLSEEKGSEILQRKLNSMLLNTNYINNDFFIYPEIQNNISAYYYIFRKIIINTYEYQNEYVVDLVYVFSTVKILEQIKQEKRKMWVYALIINGTILIIIIGVLYFIFKKT